MVDARRPAGRHRRAGRHAGPQRRVAVRPDRDRHHGRPPPRQRHLPRRRHRVPPPRRDRAPAPTAYVVRDVGSLNGTYLNRERIEEAPLANGDELQIGKFKLCSCSARRSHVTRAIAHLSIGEVLNLLQDEFPDITISKIRFLESQGLLDPERTPSGYRKFYEERHRAAALDPAPAEGELPAAQGHQGPPGRRASSTTPPSAAVTAPPPPRARPDGPAARRAPPPTRPPTGATPPRRSRPELDAAGRRSRARARPRTRTRPTPAAPPARGRRREPEPDAVACSTPSPTGVSLTRDEVLARTGLVGQGAGRARAVRAGGGPLAGQHRLLRRRRPARGPAGRRVHGPRRRGPAPADVQGGGRARGRACSSSWSCRCSSSATRGPAQATERLDELAGLGGRLRSAMLRQALQDHLGTTP